jgi:hypothetical protein
MLRDDEIENIIVNSDSEDDFLDDECDSDYTVNEIPEENDSDSVCDHSEVQDDDRSQPAPAKRIKKDVSFIYLDFWAVSSYFSQLLCI